MFRVRALSRIYFSIILIIAITVIGTLGFVLVEGYSYTDALYMTVITVSTVGYGEVEPLSSSGKIFASFLIITTFGTFAYTLSSVSTFIMGGEYKNYFNRLRLEKRIGDLENHVIICGYGRVGLKAVDSIASHGLDYVVIELDEDKLDLLDDAEDILYVKGNATADEVLAKAGIQRASAIITTMPNDADNLYTVLTAREANPDMTIISRASRRASVKKLRIAGANNVIMPDSVGGAHMASLVVNPDVQEFLDQIAIQGAADVTLEERILTEVRAGHAQKTIREIFESEGLDVNIIGLRDQEGSYVINPSMDEALVAGSKFFVLGNPNEVNRFSTVLGAISPR